MEGRWRFDIKRTLRRAMHVFLELAFLKKTVRPLPEDELLRRVRFPRGAKEL